MSLPRPEWFPFRAVPYGNAVSNGRPREEWDWTVISDNDPDESATTFDCESEEIAGWLAGVLNATQDQHSGGSKGSLTPEVGPSKGGRSGDRQGVGAASAASGAANPADPTSSEQKVTT